MKESQIVEDMLIDEFYEESSGGLDDSIKNSEGCRKYREKLEASSKKLDTLTEDVFNISIDTMSIIEQAQTLKESRKLKNESIFFIIVSAMLLALYGTIGAILGPNVILISQAVILSLAPWVMIPIIMVKRKGSEA
jgi:hypothetical protein